MRAHDKLESARITFASLAAVEMALGFPSYLTEYNAATNTKYWTSQCPGKNAMEKPLPEHAFHFFYLHFITSSPVDFRFNIH